MSLWHFHCAELNFPVKIIGICGDNEKLQYFEFMERFLISFKNVQCTREQKLRHV